jgi:hypothetical protein
MMFLCGLDNDGQPVAISLDKARTVVLIDYEDGPWLLVEFSDSEVSRSVDALGSVVCEAASVVMVLMSMKERKP